MADDKAGEILDRAIAHLRKSGVDGFSLASLASELQTSSRMLIYHFGSRDQLLARVQNEMRRDLTNELREREFTRLSGAVLATWNYYVVRLTHMEVFFHVVSRSFQEPESFTEFSASAVTTWTDLFREVAKREGYPRVEAETMSHVALAGFRGLILDLAITGDLKRLNRSMTAFCDMLDSRGTAVAQPASAATATAGA